MCPIVFVESSIFASFQIYLRLLDTAKTHKCLKHPLQITTTDTRTGNQPQAKKLRLQLRISSHKRCWQTAIIMDATVHGQHHLNSTGLDCLPLSQPSTCLLPRSMPRCLAAFDRPVRMAYTALRNTAHIFIPPWEEHKRKHMQFCSVFLAVAK